MQLPEKIELKVGEKYTLRLKGMGVAGYNIEEIEKVISVSSEFVDDGKKAVPLPPGNSQDVLITIETLVPGHAPFTLYNDGHGKRINLL